MAKESSSREIAGATMDDAKSSNAALEERQKEVDRKNAFQRKLGAVYDKEGDD